MKNIHFAYGIGEMAAFTIIIKRAPKCDRQSMLVRLFAEPRKIMASGYDFTCGASCAVSVGHDNMAAGSLSAKLAI